MLLVLVSNDQLLLLMIVHIVTSLKDFFYLFLCIYVSMYTCVCGCMHLYMCGGQRGYGNPQV